MQMDRRGDPVAGRDRNGCTGGDGGLSARVALGHGTNPMRRFGYGVSNLNWAKRCAQTQRG